MPSLAISQLKIIKIEEAVSDFPADEVGLIASDERVARPKVAKGERRKITLERSFACAIIVGLVFWLTVAYLIWGR